MRLLMGYFSCVAGSSTSEDRAAAAAGVVVVDWEGNLVRHEAPATVAELMLEAPGHLVASAEEATRTRRAIALRADEPLSPGGVYLLFPAGRAGSRVPDQQMAAAALDLARREGKRRRGGRKRPAGGRVFPGLMACEEQGKKDEEEEEEGKRKGGDTKPIFSGKSDVGGGFRGVGGARPWRPVLETIDESV